MTRGVRVLRGSLGASVAVLLAAASHGIAGGVITWASVAATVVLTLPLCVALAGRVGSVWRLALAVSAAQFLYHWTFAGLGVAAPGASGAAGATPVSPHAAHLAALESFSPRLAEAGTADTAMWIWHLIAAVLTTVLLARGERAFLALGRALRRVLTERPRQLAPLPRALRPAARFAAPRALLDRLLTAGAITRRGPPLPA